MAPEAILVGAGPAGSSTAYHLARRGRRVLLLDRATFPRDKSCGDGLTRLSVRLLAEMGVLDELRHAQSVRGVRAFMRGRGERTFEYPAHLPAPNGGLVVPRLILDEILCRHAVAAGAELWERATVTRLIGGREGVTGVEVEHRGERRAITAAVVVAADGAASGLTARAGLFEGGAPSPGFAIRAYYDHIEGLTDLLELYTPLLDPTDRYLLPSYGWVFPTGLHEANIGVGLFERAHDANVRELMARFLDHLRATDSRFAAVCQASPLKGAPLRFDFSPDRCTVPGFAAVGDAAGLISPFTGEGIGYALESGKLAAESIDRALAERTTNDVAPDVRSYAMRLASSYTGYFETGRQSAHRYKLVWHVLESTFQNDRPLFTLCRQVALFPEGLGESYVDAALEDVADLVDSQALPVRADLLSVGELLIDSVRRDWPFLARALSATQTGSAVPFRPALLLLLASYINGVAPRSSPLLASAAVELAFLAALSHVSVEDEGGTTTTDGRDATGAAERPLSATADGVQPANWGNMSALIVGDFLLAKASQLGAAVGPRVSQQLSEGLMQACEGRVQELRNAHNHRLTEAEHLDIVARKMAHYFEVPCRLGAMLGGASAQEVAALGRYGRALGIAYQLADEAMLVANRPGKLTRVLGPPLQDGVYPLPFLVALRAGGHRGAALRDLLAASHRPDTHARVLEMVRESGAIDATLALARKYADLAAEVVATVPDGPVRRSLIRLTGYVVGRARNFEPAHT